MSSVPLPCCYRKHYEVPFTVALRTLPWILSHGSLDNADVFLYYAAVDGMSKGHYYEPRDAQNSGVLTEGMS